jgi:hypothetical protein
VGQKKQKGRKLSGHEYLWCAGTVLDLALCYLIFVTKHKGNNAHLTCFIRGNVGPGKWCDWPNFVHGKWLGLSLNIWLFNFRTQVSPLYILLATDFKCAFCLQFSHFLTVIVEIESSIILLEKWMLSSFSLNNGRADVCLKE